MIQSLAGVGVRSMSPVRDDGSAAARRFGAGPQRLEQMVVQGAEFPVRHHGNDVTGAEFGGQFRNDGVYVRQEACVGATALHILLRCLGAGLKTIVLRYAQLRLVP